MQGLEVDPTSLKKLVSVTSLQVLPQLIWKPNKCEAKAADKWKLKPLKKKKNTRQYLCKNKWNMHTLSGKMQLISLSAIAQE